MKKGSNILILFFVIFLLIGFNNSVFAVTSDGTSKYETFHFNDLPESFSWRDKDGVDYTTSVKNQEPCAACESFAMVSIIETLVQYKVGYPFDCDLSEAHLFFYSGGTTEWGVNVTDAANYLIDHGVHGIFSCGG